MPAWTPGSYLIRDYAAHIEDLHARSQDGSPLTVVKISKNRWSIETADATGVRIEYTVWAGEANVSESWVESDLALLNGAGLYLYNESTRWWPQILEIELPESWPAVHTSLPAEDSGHRFRARDYDELIDSPVVAGHASAWEFKVDGHPYALIVAGDSTFWDGEKAAADLARLVEAHQEFWKTNPLDRKYLFMNFLMGPPSGLEHDHSTVLMGSRWRMRSATDYQKWLGLASHEFFHAWNVRRMRPAALSRYDYNRESFTRELWLAEGLTSYYDNLLVFRAGLMDVSDYFRNLAREFSAYEVTPGRLIRSAELASFDTWIKHYQPDDNSVNSTVSYYRKGALIGFVTDAAIRRATDGSASLDTVMREMFARYGTDESSAQGYPRGAFEELVESVAGERVRQDLERLLRTTADPDIESALAWYGLTLDRQPGRTAAEAAGLPPPAGFGVRWRNTGGRILADNVVMGHSGAEAGILPDDELLAINGIRIRPGEIRKIRNRLIPGEEVVLTLVRGDRLIEVEATVQQAIPESYDIVPLKRLSRRQKARLEDWLGRPLKFSR